MHFNEGYQAFKINATLIPTLPWVELYIRKRKDILSIESRLSWDRFLDKESLKNINGIHKRIFSKGYCISKPATIF